MIAWMSSSFCTSIGPRIFAFSGYLSVHFETRRRFFFFSSSGRSGRCEKPQTAPSFMTNSAMAQANERSLATPRIKPFLPSNKPMTGDLERVRAGEVRPDDATPRFATPFIRISAKPRPLQGGAAAEARA